MDQTQAIDGLLLVLLTLVDSWPSGYKLFPVDQAQAIDYLLLVLLTLVNSRLGI